MSDEERERDRSVVMNFFKFPKINCISDVSYKTHQPDVLGVGIGIGSKN